MKLLKFLVMCFAIISTIGIAQANTFNPCAGVANYMARVCSNSNGSVAMCKGAQEQMQACLHR